MFIFQNDVQTLNRKSHGPTFISREAGDGRKQRPGERYRNGQRQKFGQLILRRIIEIVGTRFKAKMHQIDVDWGSALDPAWGACSATPDPLAGFKGPTSGGGERRGSLALIPPDVGVLE